MSRADEIRGRFPAVYRAGDRDKLLAAVVAALAGPLDDADTHLFRIQRSHRLLVAEQAADIVRLAAMLNLGAFHFEDLLGGDRPEDERLAAMRERVQRIARLHLEGLGTPWAVLEAAAIFLDARLVPDEPGGPVVRQVDAAGYVHRATVEFHHRAEQPRGQVHLYENPLRRRTVEPAGRLPLDAWDLENRGVDAAPVMFAITGVEERTIRPTIFSPDAAVGIVFDGIVPDGRTLLVDGTGRARLDGYSVDDWLIHFRGPTFDFAELGTVPFVVEEQPPPERPFDGDLESLAFAVGRATSFAPSAAIGRSTWTFAVAEGIYNGSAADYAVYATEHLPVGAFDADAAFDASVYDLPPSGIAGMAWDERIPSAFKLTLPTAAELEDPAREGADQPNWLGRVSSVAPRFKAAGVRAYVDTAVDAWVMGRSVLRQAAAADGEGIDAHATRLRWALADAFVPVDAAGSSEERP